jgi:hypothetical protein
VGTNQRWTRTTAGLAAVLLLATGCTAIERVDVGTGAGAGDQTGIPVALSSDGRYALIESASTNLTPGDTNGQGDLFRRDLQTGTTVRASVQGLAGTQIAGRSTEGAMDGSGRRVAFATTSSLTGADTNGTLDFYVRDLVGASTTLASVAPDGTAAVSSTQDAHTAGISTDGRFVAFVVSDRTHATTGKVYVRDLQNGTTVEVAAGDATGARFSGDGKHLVVSLYCGAGLCQAPAPVFVDLAGPTLASRSFCAGTKVAAISGTGRFVALNGGGSGGAGCLAVRTATWWDRSTDTLLELSNDPSLSIVATSIDADGRLVAGEDHRTADSQAFVTDTTAKSDTGLQSPNRDVVGVPGNKVSSGPVLSGDGTRVAFATASTNLVSDPAGNALDHVYVTAALRPTITTFAASGARGATVPLAFDGVALRPGALVNVSDVGPATVVSVTNSGRHLDATVAVPPGAAPGPHDVWLIQPGTSAVCGGCFTVT